MYNKFNFRNLLILTIVAIALVGCNGCGGSNDKDNPFANFHPENEISKYIDGYYNASLGEASNPKSGNPSVYIDFSDGLIQAYTINPQNVEIIKSIANSISSPEMEWFALGNDSISKLSNDLSVLYKKLSDPKQYKDIMAPIKRTLDKITNENNDALLVTDFEEYRSDKTEDFSAYAKQAFINWLKKGNSITFFYTDYTEVGKSKQPCAKHLYYTVFTIGKANEHSIVSKFNDAIKGKGFHIKHINLNNNPYSISNDYGGKDMTGITNKTFAKWVNYTNNANLDKKLPYEVLCLNKPWDEKLDEYVKNIIDKEDGVLMEKLILNASDQLSYKLNKLSVKLYNASDDYEYFSRCEEAKNHMPKLEKDKGKNDIWTKESAKDLITKTCYDDNTTTIKKEWVYAPSSDPENLKPIKEVLNYDENIFADLLKNSPDKVELITTFHKNYKLKNVEKADGLWRVDFVIDDATFNDSNPQLSDFEWPSTTIANTQNKSLSEAIRNTLQDPSVSPNGKIIYTYYIKLGNPNKSEK